MKEPTFPLPPELSLRVLELIARHGRRTSAELATGTGANPNTLQLRLRELTAAGRIRRRGRGRATWYPPPPLGGPMP